MWCGSRSFDRILPVFFRRPHGLKKTSSMKSKRRDLHHTWLHREKNGKLSFYCYSPRWITTAFFTKNVHVTSSVSSRVRTTDAAAVAATTLTIVTRRLRIAEVRVIYIYTFIRTQRTKCFSKANLTGLLSLSSAVVWSKETPSSPSFSANSDEGGISVKVTLPRFPGNARYD